MNPSDIPALKAEIDSDPMALGYKEPNGTWKDNATIGNLLNDKRFPLVRQYLSAAEIRKNVVVDELTNVTRDNSLNGVQKRDLYFSLVSGDSTVDATVGGYAERLMVYIFGGSSVTLQQLDAARRYLESRAVILGFGVVEYSDVQTARDF